jgi:hypothetical protein
MAEGSQDFAAAQRTTHHNETVKSRRPHSRADALGIVLVGVVPMLIVIGALWYGITRLS